MTMALREAAQGLESTITKLDGAITARDEQLSEMLAELTRSSASIRRAADQANALISQNREDIRAFTEDGLPALTGLAEDATRAVNEFNALVRDVRQNPARFFFGDPTSDGVRLR
jgi:ABC-type transporter Mla subunit MlaD